MKVRELCDRHGYPDLLRDALVELADVTRSCLPGASVLLSGSLPTGDFLWRERDGPGPAVELLSDIDGFAFATSSGADLEALWAGLREIEARTASPRFHIDLALSAPSVLRRVAASFQMAEARQAGFTLTGDDPRSHFPKDFDPAASRQSLLVNLWKPVPVWRNRTEDAGAGFALAASRLMMDVATLALSEAGRCVPGHQARAALFLAGEVGDWAGDPALRDAVDAAAQARRSPPGDPAVLEPLLFPAVSRLVDRIDGQGPPARDPGPSLVRRLEAWLPARTPRRRLGEVRSLLQRPRRPDRDLRWLLARKEAVSGACLLGWLRWLAEGAEGPPPPGVVATLELFARVDAPGGEGDAFHRPAVALFAEAWRAYSPSAA